MRFLYSCGIGGGGYGMMLIPLFLIGLAIYAVYKISGKNSGMRNIDSSLEILNERFVNGEISEDEYKRKKDLILKH